MACHLLCTGSSSAHCSSNGVSPSLNWVIIGSLVQAMACHLLCTGSSLVHCFKQWRVTCFVLGHHCFIVSSSGVSPALYWVIIGSLVQAMACHLLCAEQSLVHWFNKWRFPCSVLVHHCFFLFKQWRATCSVLGYYWFIASSNGVSHSLYWVIIDSLVQAMAYHLLCIRSSLVL